MRISIPGLPGVSYDTDGQSTALTVALTAAGRRAPKPHGYAVQVLPYLWELEIDLQEVPPDHPIQYLHPDGARSVQSAAPHESLEVAAGNVDRLGRLLWAISEETERGFEQLAGAEPIETREHADGGVVIEIDDGSLEDDSGSGSTDRS
ncbi:hypothetical protein [Natronosalvus vescus]|uniref:hypothetical protein n=1 Tax=Natronosalvus vescus TaxID=2953881 RepID=UPI0020905295|nr:hypothetical protein [Natronosalvus vescus]